ncbi:hypothetical protein AB6A40_006713 [Gnathostoma spinigerum]|uniref:Decapping nuclease n=1 Tax=Gnathostoma spinigerum TaxID=75299 RepID=A0ABD6EPB8_9BILA
MSAGPIPLISIDPSGYKANFPSFEYPKVIGEYSVKRDHSIILGRGQARYLYEEALKNGNPCSFDLSQGFDTFDRKDELENEKLDDILNWLLLHAESCNSVRKICHESDFVCYRGTLTRIAATPFNQGEGWKICAVRLRDVIFLCEYNTEAKIQQIQSMTLREKMMTYWGFKFEQYMTVPSLKGHPDTEEAVTNKESFSIVVTNRFGSKPNGPLVLYSAETDCIDSEGDYVELKTQRQAMQGRFWQQKSMKWWIQSFLVGIRSIVVGLRDDSGIVHRLQRLNVKDIPHNAKGWSGAVTFNFLLSTLQSIKSFLNKCEELEYVMIEYSPGANHVKVTKLPPKHEFAFLPENFVRHFNIH